MQSSSSTTGKNSESRSGRLSLLGQVLELPGTVWGALSVFALVGGICVLAWILTVQAKPENLGTIAATFAAGSASVRHPVPPPGPYQIQFWTPSSKTKQMKGAFSWEVFESDEKLDDFATHLLKDRRVRGYRRYEVIGQGVGSQRVGMWWVTTVSEDYAVSDLVRAYHDFWKTENEGSIYVEVLRGQAGKHVN